MKIRASSDLLISHWRFAPKLRTMVQANIDILQEDIGDTLGELQRMLHVDTAKGVWLDFLGLRVGIERPLLQAPANFERFGFETGTATIAAYNLIASGGSPLIPAGSRIRAASGYIFQTTSPVSITSGSSAFVYMIANSIGPVPIPASQETAEIIDPIEHWSVARAGLPSDGTIGTASTADSFDQVPFKGGLENRQRYPMSDLLFRRLVKARGVLVANRGDFKSFERAVHFIDPDAEVTDNRDMTVTIASNLQEDMLLADRVGALPRPAGVRIINAQSNLFGFKNDLGSTASGEGFDRVRFR